MESEQKQERKHTIPKEQQERWIHAVGERIRIVRKAKGFTQEEFALTANIDRAYYGGVERGERNLAATNLIRIAKALGVEVGELFPPIGDLT